jgi:hypothetical protein
MISSVHSQLNAYVVVIVLLAIGIGIYGLMNLSAAFKIPNYRADIEQSDKFVIGFFNVVISAVALFFVWLVVR